MLIPQGYFRLALVFSCALFFGCAAVDTAVIEGVGADIAWPPPPHKPRIKFIGSFSKTRPKQFFDEKGWAGKTWKFLIGEREGSFLVSPYGVTVDGGKTVYIVNRDTKLITALNLQTKDAFAFTYQGSETTDFPICIAAGKYIYISYPKSGRVRFFDRKGRFLKEIGQSGELMRPTGLAYNEKSGFLYVVDTKGHKVKVFDPEGRHLFSVGRRGPAEGQLNYPTHIFIAADGKVYIND